MNLTNSNLTTNCHAIFNSLNLNVKTEHESGSVLEYVIEIQKLQDLGMTRDLHESEIDSQSKYALRSQENNDFVEKIDEFLSAKFCLYFNMSFW